MKKNSILLPPASRWGIFLLSFAVLFIIAALAFGVVNALPISSSARMLTGSFLQGLLAFILPTYITFRLTSTDANQLTGLDVCPTWRNIAGILLLYALSFPAMNQIIYYNASMTLPDSFNGIEQQLRQWEEAGAAATQQILSTTSVPGIICNVLIVGIFTGFAEEMFFRAGLQKLLILSKVNHHLAVWTAAVIFSTVHFQFFGFVPRVLLGAMFGYAYLWTGSIWNAAALHALNNSLVVITTWLTARGIIASDIDTLFVAETGFPWLMTLSIAATLTFLIIFRRPFFHRRRG